MQSKSSHVVRTPLQMSRVQAGTEVRFPAGALCKNFAQKSDRNCHSEIILHNAGRRTHVAKIAGAHQGKISGLCWADDHRVLSCGADKNIKMWDVRLGAPLDSSGAGPSQVRFSSFSISSVF
jgi:WD40 repeat protein